MRRAWMLAIVPLLAACTSASAPIALDASPDAMIAQVAPVTTDDDTVRVYDTVDGELVATIDGELAPVSTEDWCAVLEGEDQWLPLDDVVVFDAETGTFVPLPADGGLGSATEPDPGSVVIVPGDEEYLDTFLRLPVPSPLVCRAAVGDD